MKKSRFTEQQIVSIIREGDTCNIAEVSKKYGISPATYFLWKKKFRGMEVADVKKLRSLENENSHLKKLVAELALENRVLKVVNEKKY